MIEKSKAKEPIKVALRNGKKGSEKLSSPFFY